MRAHNKHRKFNSCYHIRIFAGLLKPRSLTNFLFTYLQRSLMLHQPEQCTAKRYEFLDFVRGIAIGLMLIYHFFFGLSQLGVLDVDFSVDLVWVSFRFVIVFLFLSLVGIGLYLTARNKVNWPSYFKRLALLFLYFSLITVFSRFVRPQYFVEFGILHLIFLSSILGLLFVRFYWANLLVGLLVVGFGYSIQSHLFDYSPWQWLGMSYSMPITDDYAPVFPWFGLVLVGIYLGRLLFEKGAYIRLLDWQSKHWALKLISWGGRYSIHIYFVHFQAFYLLVYWFG